MKCFNEANASTPERYTSSHGPETIQKRTHPTAQANRQRQRFCFTRQAPLSSKPASFASHRLSGANKMTLLNRFAGRACSDQHVHHPGPRCLSRLWANRMVWYRYTLCPGLCQRLALSGFCSPPIGLQPTRLRRIRLTSEWAGLSRGGTTPPTRGTGIRWLYSILGRVQ